MLPRGYSGYADVNWFLRALRVMPVIAGAALVGGLIGGFAVFAVDSALNWEPASQARVRAENQASMQTNPVEQRATKPVRVVGGAIPDPSAGMSAPPPVSQPQRSVAPVQPRVSSELLAAKPLGPATRLQPQTAAASSVAETPNQPSNTNQISVGTQNPTATQQQSTRWPDALSRVHRNAAKPPNPPAQSSPSPAASPGAVTTSKTGETEDTDTNHAAAADDQDKTVSARHGRHSRRQPAFSANPWRDGSDNDSAAASLSRRQDARSYDRLYDSSADQTRRSYGGSREPFYGAAGDGDQYETGTRSDSRRYRRDAGSRNRSRVITREQPGDQTLDARQQRSEPFWGGGFFGRGYRDND